MGIFVKSRHWKCKISQTVPGLICFTALYLVISQFFFFEFSSNEDFGRIASKVRFYSYVWPLQYFSMSFLLGVLGILEQNLRTDHPLPARKCSFKSTLQITPKGCLVNGFLVPVLQNTGEVLMAFTWLNWLFLFARGTGTTYLAMGQHVICVIVQVLFAWSCDMHIHPELVTGVGTSSRYIPKKSRNQIE